MKKKKYIAPESEILSFSEKDVITSSGNLFEWELPSVDLGNEDSFWNTDGNVFISDSENP